MKRRRKSSIPVGEAAFAAPLARWFRWSKVRRALDHPCDRIEAAPSPRSPRWSRGSATRLPSGRPREGRDLYDASRMSARRATLESHRARAPLPRRRRRPRDGTAPDGGRLRTSREGQLLTEAFESDVGVVTSGARRRGRAMSSTTCWRSTPERDRTIDEVKDAIVTAWTVGRRTASRSWPTPC